MKSTPLRVAPYTGMERDPGATAPASAAGRRRAGKTSTDARSKLNDPKDRADAIGRAAPFSAWPRDVLLRLAAACSVSSHRHGTCLFVAGQRCDKVTVIAQGVVVSSVSSPGGRRVTFKIDDSSFAYGLAPLADGLAHHHDLVADGPAIVICIPLAAIRAELTRRPALWESIALEVIRRSRVYVTQLHQFQFDAPLVRTAAILLGLLAKDSQGGPVTIDLRLPQERLAEMLGTSRQWATKVARELCEAGIVEWRYGRVTVLDVLALRALAARGVVAMGQHSA
jgi:CRP-like cAMP-binding protein